MTLYISVVFMDVRRLIYPSWYACVVTSIHTLCIPCMIIEAHDSREGNLKGVVHMNVFNSV